MGSPVAPRWGLWAVIATGLSGDLPMSTVALSGSQHSLFQGLREQPAECRPRRHPGVPWGWTGGGGQNHNSRPSAPLSANSCPGFALCQSLPWTICRL